MRQRHVLDDLRPVFPAPGLQHQQQFREAESKLGISVVAVIGARHIGELVEHSARDVVPGSSGQLRLLDMGDTLAPYLLVVV